VEEEKKLKFRKVLVVALVLIAAGSTCVYFTCFRPRISSSEKIFASGTIEATEVDVCPEVSGKIVSLLVEEGDLVKAGQVLAEIESEELKAKYQQAEAQVESAKAQVARAKAALEAKRKSAEAQLSQAEAAFRQAKAQYEKALQGPRPQEVKTAAANLEAAKAQLDLTRKTFERIEFLYEQGAVSEQELDEAEAKLEVAAANLEKAAQQLSITEEGTRQEDLAAAAAAVDYARAAVNLAAAQKEVVRAEEANYEAALENLKQAEALLAQAKAALDKTVIKAPLDGVVLLKNFEVGELAVPGVPLVTLGDLSKVWLRLYLPEPEIGKIKLGQEVEVRVDSFPKRVFKGKIVNISQKAEFTPKFVQTKRERVNMVFAVKVLIPNEQGLLKPGMPADAVITCRSRGD